MEKKTTVWGLGNEVYGDDAVGIVVVQKLNALPLPKHMEAYSCYTVPGNYVARLRGHTGRLIIVDAADMDITPGEFRRFSMDEIADVSFTNHDMPLNLLLADLRDTTTIIGVQTERVELGAPLSLSVEGAATRLAELIRLEKFEEIPPLVTR